MVTVVVEMPSITMMHSLSCCLFYCIPIFHALADRSFGQYHYVYALSPLSLALFINFIFFPILFLSEFTFSSFHIGYVQTSALYVNGMIHNMKDDYKT